MADDETHIGRNNEEREEDENRRIMGKALEGAAVETVQDPEGLKWEKFPEDLRI